MLDPLPPMALTYIDNTLTKHTEQTQQLLYFSTIKLFVIVKCKQMSLQIQPSIKWSGNPKAQSL